MIKRHYIQAMQGLGSIGTFAKPEVVTQGDEHGWQRWFASLFAIYDTDRMIQLDLPWWNVAATREIANFLSMRSAAKVLEYGAGASTMWLAKRCESIVSVEHDKRWLDTFKRQTAGQPNVKLLYRPIEDGRDAYVRAIREFDEQFDLIVIDGRHRSACLKEAESRLKRNGVIVFDDSGRSRYRAAITDSPLVETRHFGRSYCVPYPDYTSLLRHGEG